MIQVMLIVDIDERKIGAFDRKIRVMPPAGYSVSHVRVISWGRNLADGSVELDIAFKISGPADLLPRVTVGGDKR